VTGTRPVGLRLLSRQIWSAAYVPAGIERKDPRISVLFADLEGLPPTLIQVGSAETLLDDAVRFAAEAGTHGVFVTLEIWPDMIHAWHLWNAHLAAGQRALINAGELPAGALGHAVLARLRSAADSPFRRFALFASARAPIACQRSHHCWSEPVWSGCRQNWKGVHCQFRK
jgi:acetyl esterase/lipase